MTEVLESGRSTSSHEIALADLLDRLLAAGVVISGDIVLSIADVDLVYISIRALITSIRESDDSNGAVRVREARHVERTQ